MDATSPKLYFQRDTLVRREHFGILILMKDGTRYLVNNKYLNFLKFLYKKQNGGGYGGILQDDKEGMLKFLINKEIVGFQKKNAKPKFIENDFISLDCISFPRTVYLECTRRCNFNCIHCYSSSGNNLKEGELTIAQVKILIKELSERGTEFLSIGGGEPFFYPQLIEVVRCAINNEVSVEISTNASLVNDDNISKLKRAGLKFIQVSLDGATAETYSKIRKGGDFNKVIDNIRKLVKHFIVSTCVVVHKLNYKEIDDIVDLSISLGVKSFRIIPFMEVGRASKMGYLQLSQKEFQDLYKMIIRKKESTKNKIFIQLNENLIVPQRKNISWMPDNHYGCSAGRTTCGIDSYGNVYPCSYMVFDELKCGNIKNESLAGIWKNSSVMKKIRTISSLKGKCSKCKYLDLCRGGCRAAAYLKRYDIRDSDYLCSVK